MPAGSVAGIASQQLGPALHVGFDPEGAVQYAPKWSSNVWFSWMTTTTCLMFEAGQGPAHVASSGGRDGDDEELWHAAETRTAPNRGPARRARFTCFTSVPCYALAVRNVRSVARLALAAVAVVSAGCDDESPVDTIADTSVDAAVWRADARKLAAALPARVGSFAPSEGADPFNTSYGTGPVFGASCAYADGERQLIVRVESGNIRSRATAALDPRGEAGTDSRFETRAAKVHGHPALQRWSGGGRVGEVTFLVARRYLVQVRVVPAANESEASSIAESLDVGPLERLALDGVTR